MSLSIGDTIPEFTLKDQEENDFSSTQLVGKQPFVVYFYPKDYTPGCTREACSFRDAYQDFKDMGAEVIGISSDSSKSHKKFANSYHLPFILLADPDKKVRKQFGVPANFFGLFPGRETYVFDKEGKVIMVFNSMKATDHIKKALESLKTQA
ncbi:peroxiredoxin [Leptobacterium sp. I13]|uniref:peroxiredoxin n=1 Tax=Leptobacterium meishanense TaxID=3128904 RepID=UPI0030EE5A46